jgi:hypothetical protein
MPSAEDINLIHEKDDAESDSVNQLDRSASKPAEEHELYDACEFKPDQQIVLAPSENEMYRCVERPANLLQFTATDIEHEFSLQVKQNSNLSHILTTIAQVVVLYYLLYLIISKYTAKTWFHALWILIGIPLEFALYFLRTMIAQKSNALFQCFDIIKITIPFALLMLVGDLKFKILNVGSQIAIFHALLLLAFSNKSMLYRPFMVIATAACLIWTACQVTVARK